MLQFFYHTFLVLFVLLDIYKQVRHLQQFLDKKGAFLPFIRYNLYIYILYFIDTFCHSEGNHRLSKSTVKANKCFKYLNDLNALIMILLVLPYYTTEFFMMLDIMSFSNNYSVRRHKSYYINASVIVFYKTHYATFQRNLLFLSYRGQYSLYSCL